MGLLSNLKDAMRRYRLGRMDPETVFSDYFRRSKWRDPDSRSGKGSNLAATAEVRVLLPGLLRDLEVRSFLDLPCGDFFWMQHVDLAGVKYLGGDIVPDLIAQNRASHARTDRDFQVIDLIKGPVPRADLVFVRDCLVHLSYDHARAALANIHASGATWLLTTTFPTTSENRDIVTGEWRKLDLTKAPFNLPAPARLIAEGAVAQKGQGPDKYLGLWRVADIVAFER